MAHAMLRLLATPTTRPVVPARSSGTAAPYSSGRRPALGAARTGGTLPPSSLRRMAPSPPVARSCPVAAFLGATGDGDGHPYITASSPPAGRHARLGARPWSRSRFNEPVELLRSQDLDVVDSSGAPVSSGPGQGHLRQAGGRDPPAPRAARRHLHGALPDHRRRLARRARRLRLRRRAGRPGQPYFSGNGSGGPSETGVVGHQLALPRDRRPGRAARPARLPLARLGAGPPAPCRGEPRASATPCWPGAATPSGWASACWRSARCSPRATCWWCRARACSGTGVLDDPGRRDRHQPGAERHPLRIAGAAARRAAVRALRDRGVPCSCASTATQSAPRPPTATGSRAVGIAMAALLLAVLGGIATQGHASVDVVPDPPGGRPARCTWRPSRCGSSGLALVALVHLRLPRIAPDGGPIVAKRGARALLEGRPGGRGGSPS